MSEPTVLGIPTSEVTVEKLEEKIKERRRIARLIRTGALPRFMFAKGEDEKMERKMTVSGSKYGRPPRIKNKLTWRLISTLYYLTKD